MSTANSYHKKLILLLVLVVFSGIELVAQRTNTAKPLPPPARSGYIFESPEGGFKIDFPSKPLVQTIEKETSFGKNPITTCGLATGFASYAVTFVDFPTLMTDKYDLNVRFDMMRDAQAKRMSARIMQDEEWYFGSYYGRRNVLETDSETLSLRTLIAGPRLFVLIVTTKGKLSTQAESLRTSNQARIDRFFNSFIVTRVAKATQLPVELPSDFNVSLTGKEFSSEFFDLKMAMPENWIFLSQDKSNLILGLGKEIIARKDPKLAEHTTDQTARMLATFAKSDPETTVSDAYLIVLAEKAPYPNFLASAVAKSYSQLHVNKNEKITVPVTMTQIHGIDFAWLETFKPISNLYNRFYVANRKGISFEVLVIYKDPVDLKTMLGSLQSLTSIK